MYRIFMVFFIFSGIANAQIFQVLIRSTDTVTITATIGKGYSNIGTVASGQPCMITKNIVFKTGYTLINICPRNVSELNYLNNLVSTNGAILILKENIVTTSGKTDAIYTIYNDIAKYVYVSSGTKQ